MNNIFVMALNDEDVMLKALRAEREQVHDRLMQLDRIIKRVKAGDYIGFVTPKDRGVEGSELTVESSALPLNEFPKTADIKIQVIKVIDDIGKAAKLKDIQTRYSELSGNIYNIREPLRSLHRSRILRMIRVKDATRGIFWVKVEWLENGQLLDEFKPIGFDLVYRPENLIYE